VNPFNPRPPRLSRRFLKPPQPRRYIMAAKPIPTERTNWALVALLVAYAFALAILIVEVFFWGVW
jgi:hypothetical protein